MATSRQSRQASMDGNAISRRSASGKRRRNVPVRTLIERLDAKINALEEQRKVLSKNGQKKCSHPASEILEAEYVGGTYFSTPPFRVCKLCGYAEEGWHCGYWKLRDDNPVPSVSREAAMKYVIGGVLSQKQMSDLRFGR